MYMSANQGGPPLQLSPNAPAKWRLQAAKLPNPTAILSPALLGAVSLHQAGLLPAAGANTLIASTVPVTSLSKPRPIHAAGTLGGGSLAVPTSPPIWAGSPAVATNVIPVGASPGTLDASSATYLHWYPRSTLWTAGQPDAVHARSTLSSPFTGLRWIAEDGGEPDYYYPSLGRAATEGAQIQNFTPLPELLLDMSRIMVIHRADGTDEYVPVGSQDNEVTSSGWGRGDSGADLRNALDAGAKAGGDSVNIDTEDGVVDVASDAGAAAGKAGGGGSNGGWSDSGEGDSGGWSDSGGGGASSGGGAGGNESSPSNDNENQGGGDSNGDGHDPDAMPDPDGPDGGGPNWDPAADFVSAALSSLANPGSLPAEVEMPDPDGSGPVGPNVRVSMVVSSRQDPKSRLSQVEMPNPDGGGPVGPNVRAASVRTLPANPGSLPSQVEVPNPDGSGPVGPAARAAVR